MRRGDERVSGDRVDHGTTSEAEQGRRADCCPRTLPARAGGAVPPRLMPLAPTLPTRGPPLVPQL
ncbi:hypothetical protein Y09_1912 [Brachybacterium sp. SW0106-09]|nr:hypothetical protein Y09_1912 [Brachybacterium sp. SW0106-09]